MEETVTEGVAALKVFLILYKVYSSGYRWLMTALAFTQASCVEMMRQEKELPESPSRLFLGVNSCSTWYMVLMLV